MINKILLVLLIAYLTAFCQSILANIMSIGGIAPDFVMIIIMLVVLREEFSVAFPLALMIGVIADALVPETLGYGAFVRFGLAVVIYELRQHLNLDQWYSRLYVLVGVELVFQIGYQLLAASFDLVTMIKVFVESSLPTLLYTALLGAVLLFVLDLEVRIEIARKKVD